MVRMPYTKLYFQNDLDGRESMYLYEPRNAEILVEDVHHKIHSGFGNWGQCLIFFLIFLYVRSYLLYRHIIFIIRTKIKPIQ